MSHPREDHLPALDGLRGFAALIVFISHAAAFGLLPKILAKEFGQQGVMLFFVLSGFLMARLYADKSFTKQNVGTYARHRIARVVPLYLIVVLASWIFAPFLIRGVRGALLENLFFVRGGDVLWAIPAEVQFYLAFVVLWWVLQTKGRGAFWVACLVLLAISVCAVVLSVLFTGGVGYVASFKSAHFFLIGIAISLFCGRHKTWVQTVRTGRYANWLGYAVIAFGLLAIPQLREMNGWPHIPIWLDPMTIVIVPGLFIAALFEMRPWGFLGGGLFRGLGRISYSFYLLHFPILRWVIVSLRPDTDAEAAAAFVIALSLTLLAARLSFAFMERPFQDLVRGKRPFRVVVV